MDVYGSRSMGNYHKGSDVDLVIYTNVTENIAGLIKTVLEALPTPYMFDVTDYNHINHEGLKEHIDRVSKPIYVRSK